MVSNYVTEISLINRANQLKNKILFQILVLRPVIIDIKITSLSMQIIGNVNIASLLISWHYVAPCDKLHILDVSHKPLILVNRGRFVVLCRCTDVLNIIKHFFAHVVAEQAPQMLNERVRKENLPLTLIVVKENVKVALPKILSLPAKQCPAFWFHLPTCDQGMRVEHNCAS